MTDSLLDRSAPCRLCPRQCGVARDADRGSGFCAMGTDAVIARAALHLWEEPCISGTRGTGAVFFSGCTLQCCYCQNWCISHEGEGQRVSARQLADIFRRLEEEGAHSLSLITATQFLPAILEALSLYRPRVPVVYNCGGFERVEVVWALADAVDVWLPDIKNHSPRLSKLLLGRGDYFQAASAAVRQMCALSGPPQYDAQGILTRGTLVRHLVIPGCATDSIQVLRFIADELPPGTPLSLMRQYTPIPQCTVPGLDRRVTEAEYRRVLRAALDLGLTGYLQDAESADSAYTPPFDGTGVPGKTKRQ